MKRLRHQGDDIRLRDGLPQFDGQGGVEIGELFQLGGQEHFAPHLLEGAKHALVSNASSLELLLDQIASLFVQGDHDNLRLAFFAETNQWEQLP